MSSTVILPTLAPPEYLDAVVQASSNIDLKQYLSELGLSNNLRRISPNVDPTRRYNRVLPSINIPAPFTDPPLVRSEAWSSCDFIKSSKKRRWIRFKTKFISSIKSIKCRFTALGLVLGWLTSLGALIPILILWLRSSSTSSATTLSTISTGITGFSFNVTTAVPECSIWYCQEVVIFNSNMTIISLSLVVTVQSTGGETYAGAFDTSSAITFTNNNGTTQLSYTFSVSNSSLPVGNYTCGVEFSPNGVNHTTSADTFTITATDLCGVTKTISGTFQ